ncbi:uncharacterized protein LOC130717144 [Lotus japonicus]|uniref:uncharacterized protein LOC130717144 n=1 Tax=Lotus japonicus TaxID=34305 RepID=UPI0025866904|nr:uncharacterized protein LOC130717144 [Lotus japonicus]
MASETVISPETVSKAVASLLKWRKSQSETQKPNLLGLDEEFVYLVLTLKKVPQKGRVNPHKLPLPHSLHSDFSQHCLILDDRANKGRVTKADAQAKIKAESIPIAKVLKLSKLTSDYRPFEAKRKLCDSYDLFFTDKAVVPLLARLLGKQFFKKRKVPVPLDLTKKNWKEQVEKACSSAMMFLRTGTCSVVRVAKVSMEKDEIVENVVAAVRSAVELVPKKWGNVRSLHVKMLDSLPLPIYQTVPDVRLKIDGGKAEAEAKEKESVKEKKKGEDGDKEVGKKNKKGRIHQVKYMDVDAALGSKDEDGDNAVIGDDAERSDGGVEKLESKKREKGSKVGKEAAKLTIVKTLGEPETPKEGVKRRKNKDGSSAKVTKEGLVKKGGDKFHAKKEGSSEKKKKKLKGADVKVKAKKIKKAAA